MRALPLQPGMRAALLMAVLMLAVSVLAYAVRPVHKLADARPRIQLEQLVPERFGPWRTVRVGAVVLPDPQALQTLDRIYTQLLSRTYVNDRGVVVMLSIAYGDDQRAAMAVHYPEVCYPAQGFALDSSRTGAIDTVQGRIPVRRLETSLAQQRYEPVTYWTTIGDTVSLGGFEKRLIELRHGLRREIPDGLLVRVSTINRDSARAFADQEAFTRDLLAHLGPEGRRWLAGAARAAPAPAP